MLSQQTHFDIHICLYVSDFPFILDHTIRIWRVFPFTADALAPLMFIVNSEPATHLLFSNRRLCVALQDVSTATYNITMFKTMGTEPGMLTNVLEVAFSFSWLLLLIALVIIARALYVGSPVLAVLVIFSTFGMIKKGVTDDFNKMFSNIFI